MEYREKIKINVGELVEEYVRQCELEYPPDETSQKVYSESLKKMEHIDLQCITEENTKEIIKPYLWNWGSMARVLGQEKKYPKWQSNLAKAIQKNLNALKDSSKDLIDAKLNDPKVKTDIQSCYEAFKGPANNEEAYKDPDNRGIGRIAATKVLHLICPNFFPMWDNAIADGIRKELKNGDKDTSIEDFSKEDYYRFMCVIQDFLKQNEHVLSKLARKHHKTRLRVLDECLLWAVRRPYYLFSFRIAKISTS